MMNKLIIALLLGINLTYGQSSGECVFSCYLEGFVKAAEKTDNLQKGTVHIYTIDIDYFSDTSDFCIELASDFHLTKSDYSDSEFYFKYKNAIFILEKSIRARKLAEYLGFSEIDLETKLTIEKLLPVSKNWDTSYFFDFFCISDN